MVFTPREHYEDLDTPLPPPHTVILIQSIWSGSWRSVFVCKFLQVILIIEDSVAGSIIKGNQTLGGTIELYDLQPLSNPEVL